MKILLVNPPFNRLKGIKDIYFPLGLGYLAGSLEKEGFDVSIYNAEVGEGDIWNEYKQVLKDINPDIVAISSSSAKFHNAVEIARLFKEFNKKGKIILGGPHATICPKEVANELIDFVVKGEGEKTIVELCQAIKDNKDYSHIKGLEEKRELIENLDELPFPSRSKLLFKERYPKRIFGAIITLRGCPFNCGFCAAKCMWTQKVRFRSIENVILEIKQVIKEFKTKEFFFWDDSFTLNKQRTIELCKRLKPLGIFWGCCTKVTLLDEELVRAMKKAGCASIELGVESGSQRIIDYIKKGITLEEVNRATTLLDKYHISYTLMLMAGFPSETKEDIEKTVEFIKNCKKGFICFSVFTPYPGTELYEEAKKLNLISDKIDWSKVSHHSNENAFTKIDKDEFKKYIETINALVKKHNNSFLRIWEYIRARLGFYLKHPFIFINRIKEEIVFTDE